MHCVCLFLGWLRHMFCIYKTFLMMKSNQKVGALPFRYVKKYVASEFLGRFVVFSYLACSPRISKSTHLYSTMLGVFRAWQRHPISFSR